MNYKIQTKKNDQFEGAWEVNRVRKEIPKKEEVEGQLDLSMLEFEVFWNSFAKKKKLSALCLLGPVYTFYYIHPIELSFTIYIRSLIYFLGPLQGRALGRRTVDLWIGLVLMGTNTSKYMLIESFSSLMRYTKVMGTSNLVKTQ